MKYCKQEKTNFEAFFKIDRLKHLIAGSLFLIVLLCSLLPAQSCYAQADTSLNNIINDTLRQRKPVLDTSTVLPGRSTADATPLIAKKKGLFEPNPKKAGLYSALLPGLGQLYNRQYWKLPLVYAGVGAAGYFYIKNQTEYQSYRKAYISRLTNITHPIDEYATRYPDINQLLQLQNDSKKYLDLTVLLSVVGYTLQVLDAVTSAHLKNFDISRDISMRMQPILTPQGGIGFGLAVNF